MQQAKSIGLLEAIYWITDRAMGANFYPCSGERTTARILRQNPPVVISPSWPIICELDGVTDFRERIGIALHALEYDPGCILANIELARQSPTLERRLEHLYYAVRSGEELWSPVSDELGPAMFWWENRSTRPYLEALHLLILAFVENLEWPMARRISRKLLKIDPEDHFGIGARIAELGPAAMMSQPEAQMVM